jgi:hypothetical protein
MRNIGSALIGLLCFIPPVCAAGEAQDALEVLILSLQCPNKSVKWVAPRATRFYQEVTRYTGDIGQLRLQTERTFGDGVVTRDYAEVSLADLEEVEEIDDYEWPEMKLIDGRGIVGVKIRCRGRILPHDDNLIGFKRIPNCFQEAHSVQHGTNVTNGKPVEEMEHHFQVCDAETAASVKMALRTLIRLQALVRK